MRKAEGVHQMRRIRYMAILAVVGVMLAGCGRKEVKAEPAAEEKPVVAVQEETAEEAPPVEPVAEEPVVTHEGQMQSYLTGEWVELAIGTRRPVAVMLNNIQVATPQCGISKAGVVYEAPVEGALTRLMGIFEDYDQLEKIGSVRSARNYYVYFAVEFDAIYAHFGQSAYALNLLDRDNVDNLSGLSGIGGTVYFRTTDRKAPHNAYASASGIAAGIEAKGYDKNYDAGYTGHYQFAADGESIVPDGISAMVVKPGYPINKPWFEYNTADGLYYRFQYGGIQIDEMTNQQLAYKNIILQNCSSSNFDNTQYLNINVQSGGSGKFITNGKSIDITWKKDSEFGPTRYYNTAGEEIRLNQGKTWVCIIQNGGADKVEILDTPTQQ